MKAFLLMGQSNMAGRGEFGEVPEIVNEQCFMLRNGKWRLMREPINTDRAIWGYFHSGIGLSASFADEYAKHFNEDVGLIPCADGGSFLKEWMPGEILYDHAVAQAKLAQRTSQIAGILWHQGEADCGSIEEMAQYHDRFLRMISSLMKDLNLPENTPVLIGQLGEFIGSPEMNGILKGLSETLCCGGIVSAKGLECKEDNIHFNSKSYREFGKRYFDVYLEITKEKA